MPTCTSSPCSAVCYVTMDVALHQLTSAPAQLSPPHPPHRTSARMQRCSCLPSTLPRTGTCERPAKEGVRERAIPWLEGWTTKNVFGRLGSLHNEPSPGGRCPRYTYITLQPNKYVWRAAIGRPSREGERACAPLRRDLLFQPIVKLRGPSRVLHFTHAHVCTLQARP